MSEVSNESECQICHKEKFKYTCPKCNVLYCSVSCYKCPEHLKCSEEFYKNCIQEELTTAQPKSQEDVRKIYEILKRIREADAGLSPAFETGYDDALDSDDDDINRDDNSESNEEGTAGDEDEEEDLTVRLQGVDINDADEIWRRLTPAEREDFQNQIECGDIMKLLPSYKPWWIKRQNTKIVELQENSVEEINASASPPITPNIHIFSNICRKTPSACIHYNLWNILAAYACTVRYFGGEHLTSPDEAIAQLVNLSATLKYGTNFEDVEDAIVSVEMEALTTVNSASTIPIKSVSNSFVENREQLQNDARQLMSCHHHKLAALSDLLHLVQLAKQVMKTSKGSEAGDFQKLFALCSGSIELNRKKLTEIVKRIEFLLSYVNRDNESELK